MPRITPANLVHKLHRHCLLKSSYLLNLFMNDRSSTYLRYLRKVAIITAIATNIILFKSMILKAISVIYTARLCLFA